MRISLLISIFLCLSSCSREMISVHTDYIGKTSLASYYVGTPDPLLECPPCGQRLIISWKIPQTLYDCPDLHLDITIRYKNREEIIKQLPLQKRRGSVLYYLLNEDYKEKGGIQTYKVQLIGNEQVLKEWRHQLWAELIVF